MKLVPLTAIPPASAVTDVPTGNLIPVLNACLQMEQLCVQSNGVGLAAVQVGLPWRLFLVKVGSKFEYYVNCDYSPEGEDKFPSIEGCLSIRSEDGELRYFQVDRYRRVRVKGHRLTTTPDLSLTPVDFVVTEEFLSTVFQHEIDHQKGVLISDLGREIEIIMGR